MTASPRDRARSLLREARTTENHDAKVRLSEEAVDLADLASDDHLAYRARVELVEAATFGGQPEKALVAFAWCLAFYDRKVEGRQDRHLVGSSDILWRYKWIAGQIPSFSSVSRRQIEETFEDMARRYRHGGLNLRPVHCIRWQAAERMGDVDVREEAHRLWTETPRDVGADCFACELDDVVHYELVHDRVEEALRKGRPIVSGRLSCACIPQATIAKLIVPVLRLGRIEQAAELHRRGYRHASTTRDDINYLPAHLRFLTVSRNLERGRDLLAKHTGWVLESCDEEDRFHYFLAARHLLRVLREVGVEEIFAPTPSGFPLHLRSGRIPVADLIDWAGDAVEKLESAFNARNGNRLFTEHVAVSRDLEGLVLPFPLDA